MERAGGVRLKRLCHAWETDATGTRSLQLFLSKRPIFLSKRPNLHRGLTISRSKVVLLKSPYFPVIPRLAPIVDDYHRTVGVSVVWSERPKSLQNLDSF